MDVDNENLRVKAVGLEYHYYIVEEVGEASDFAELFDVLQNASPEDIVFLHINTPGGSLTTTLQIIHAIKNSKVQVIASADGEVASAGSLIFFACDSFIINPHSFFMIHDGSGGVIGKSNENLKSAQATSLLLHKLYHEIYGRFFSKTEVDKILSGEDIYILADEVEYRLNKAIEKEEEDDGQD